MEQQRHQTPAPDVEARAVVRNNKPIIVVLIKPIIKHSEFAPQRYTAVVESTGAIVAAGLLYPMMDATVDCWLDALGQGYDLRSSELEEAITDFRSRWPNKISETAPRTFLRQPHPNMANCPLCGQGNWSCKEVVVHINNAHPEYEAFAIQDSVNISLRSSHERKD